MSEDGSDYGYADKLGRWLSAQRCSKRGVKGRKLTEDQDAQLQALVDQGMCTCVFVNVCV